MYVILSYREVISIKIYQQIPPGLIENIIQRWYTQ